MSYSATVIRILIASPSDVPEAREAIAEVIHEWNSLHSEEIGKVILPVMWESHSAPIMGDRPQAIINKQLVRKCDMLIGAFWTRIGTSTGIEESGTVEEIKHFLAAKKPAMIYHCKKAVELDIIDHGQVKRLNEFLKSIRKDGLQETYSSIEELKQKLSRQLHIILKDLLVTTTVDPSIMAQAAGSRKESIENTSSRLSKRKSNDLHIEEYSKDGSPAKSVILKGDTRHLKSEIMEMNGKWNRSLGGWIFPIGRKKEIEDFIKKQN